MPYLAANAEIQRTTPRPASPNKSQQTPPSRGFIQADHGALVPGYYHNPESFEDYTSGVGGASASNSQALSPMHSSNPIPTSGHPAMAPQFWPGYPPSAHYYPYPTAAGAPSSSQQPFIHPYLPGQHYPSSSTGSWFPTATGSPVQARPPQQLPAVRGPNIESRPTYPTIQNLNSSVGGGSQQHLPYDQGLGGHMSTHHVQSGRQHFKRDHYLIQHNRNVGNAGGNAARSPSAFRHGGKLGGDIQNNPAHGQNQAQGNNDVFPPKFQRNN